MERANKIVSKRYERLVKGASAKRSKNADEITPKSRTNEINSFEKQVSTQRELTSP